MPLCVYRVQVCACLWGDYMCTSVFMYGYSSRCVYLCTKGRLNVVAHLLLYEGRVCAGPVYANLFGEL